MSAELVWNWTGPFVWTDIIFEYLNEKHNVDWRTLVALRQPKLFGDIYILPIQAFSPNLQNVSGIDGISSQTRIKHYFKASWVKDVV